MYVFVCRHRRLVVVRAFAAVAAASAMEAKYYETSAISARSWCDAKCAFTASTTSPARVVPHELTKKYGQLASQPIVKHQLRENTTSATTATAAAVATVEFSAITAAAVAAATTTTRRRWRRPTPPTAVTPQRQQRHLVVPS